MKSYAKRNYEQVQVSSLLAAQSNRKEETMSLNNFFMNLGLAAKSSYEAGQITGEAYRARITELKAQYAELKARAA